MGWTLSGIVQFLFKEKPAITVAHGAHVAWCCPCKKAPILFVYLQGQPGSGADKPARCLECGSEYHLDPGYGARPEPPAGMPVAPSPVMRIIKK
jgi:hypothetical protein